VGWAISALTPLLAHQKRRRALKALELVWLFRFRGFLSANLPEDFKRLREAVERRFGALFPGSWSAPLRGA